MCGIKVLYFLETNRIKSEVSKRNQNASCRENNSIKQVGNAILFISISCFNVWAWLMPNNKVKAVCIMPTTQWKLNCNKLHFWGDHLDTTEVKHVALFCNSVAFICIILHIVAILTHTQITKANISRNGLWSTLG